MGLPQKQCHNPRYLSGSPSFCKNHKELLLPTAHIQKLLFLYYVVIKQILTHLQFLYIRHLLEKINILLVTGTDTWLKWAWAKRIHWPTQLQRPREGIEQGQTWTNSIINSISPQLWVTFFWDRLSTNDALEKGHIQLTATPGEGMTF